MTYTPRKPHQKPKPTPREIATTMLLHATDEEAVARIADFSARVLGVDGDEPEPEKRRARTGGSSNARRGLAVEGTFDGKGVASILHREGYTVVRSHMSKGAGDVIGLRQPGAVGPAARAIQAKRQASFRPDGVNDAIARFLGVGKWSRPFLVDEGTRREAWLWVDGMGWVARVSLVGGELFGQGELREEVIGSIRRMLERERIRRTQTGDEATFRQRLEV